MIIEESDFKLEYLEEFDCWDVYLLKVINAKDASKRREEMTLMAYGVSIESAIKRIANNRLHKKLDVISLKKYIEEFRQEISNLSYIGNICKK